MEQNLELETNVFHTCYFRFARFYTRFKDVRAQFSSAPLFIGHARATFARASENSTKYRADVNWCANALGDFFSANLF